MPRTRLAACRATEDDTANDTMIDVAIRFDDPSALSDHALERALLQRMARHAVRATFAVIPCADQAVLRPDRVPHLVEALRSGSVEIAQHGFSHQSCGTDPILPSEFAGVDPAEQASKVAAGRTVLEQAFGIPIHGFVPPFNSFDRHTASALVDQGFRYLSAGGEHGPAETSPLAQLPRTCQITELRAALAEARRRPAGDLAVVAVMHHYDFRESGQADAPLTLQTLSELFAWLRQQPGVRLSTLGELAARHAPQTWCRAVRRSRWVQQRHWRVRALFPRYSLMPRPLFNYVRLTGGRT